MQDKIANYFVVTIRNTAVGLNFIDTYHRSGLYPVEPPSHLGFEASAVIRNLGEDVEGFKLGDRVAYVNLESRSTIGSTILKP